MKTRVAVVVVLLAMIGLLAFMQSKNSRPIEPGNKESVDGGPPAPGVELEATPSDSRKIEAATETGCFSELELETHPMFADEAVRLEAVSVSGPTMDSYRALDESALLDLAGQKDPAAMAVLGARHFLLAVGSDPDQAVPVLRREDNQSAFKRAERPLSDDSRRHVEDAKHWFYASAQHGRVDALYWYGELLARFDGNVVQLGWISEEDYESLTRREKSTFNPQNLYNFVRISIVPELADGPLGEMLTALVPETRQSATIVARLTDSFLSDIKQNGLPRPTIPGSRLPDREDLFSMLCDDARKRVENMFFSDD